MLPGQCSLKKKLIFYNKASCGIEESVRLKE